MQYKKSKPPQFASFLLSILLNHAHPENMMGDFEELFHDNVMKKGLFKAKLINSSRLKEQVYFR